MATEQADPRPPGGGAGPLAGIRVLDLSRVLAGPWATQMLADFGAEVLKIEKPGSGDDTRGWGPPYLRDSAGRRTAESAYFLAANRGKRSVCLDLTQPAGAELVRRLAGHCDVLVENFKVGGLAKYGLDYASLGARYPELIYCSITGFGQTGPYRDRPGYDFMIQGMGGLMSVTGEADERPGGGPQKAGVALADILTGLYASSAVLAALNHRHSTGRGQHIDLALLDVQIACMANQALNYLVSGEAPRRLGNAHPNIVPYQTFAAADGHFILAVGNDGQFRRLCGLLQAPHWADDPDFASNAARVANRERLVPQLAERFAERPVAHWLQALEATAIPCGPINDLAQVFADPQILHRGMALQLAHPGGGTAPGVANPVRFSDSAVRYQAAPPLLGQHTEAVLRELLGLEAAELASLRRAGVV